MSQREQGVKEGKMLQLQEEWGSSLASWAIYEEGQWEPRCILIECNALGGLFCFVCPEAVYELLCCCCDKTPQPKATYGRQRDAGLPQGGMVASSLCGNRIRKLSYHMQEYHIASIKRREQTDSGMAASWGPASFSKAPMAQPVGTKHSNA